MGSAGSATETAARWAAAEVRSARHSDGSPREGLAESSPARLCPIGRIDVHAVYSLAKHGSESPGGIDASRVEK
ncbi:hypothetical protein I552_7158 [Mycobacterium xenopi 3993]|nr:hypothetical protein I552_7158 [Mycobacterium xenopi 3993]